jgi:hypothetical protein
MSLKISEKSIEFICIMKCIKLTSMVSFVIHCTHNALITILVGVTFDKITNIAAINDHQIITAL